MKKFASFLLIFVSVNSCKKEINANQSIQITYPAGKETLHAGERITATWKTTNIDDNKLVSAEIISVLPGTAGSVSVHLRPVSTEPVPSSVGDVTKNDGIEEYQIPWIYSPEGNLLYAGGLNVPTFKIIFTVGEIVGSDMWNPGASPITGISSNFTIVASVLPDGCETNMGYSVTTGQPCN